MLFAYIFMFLSWIPWGDKTPKYINLSSALLRFLVITYYDDIDILQYHITRY